MILGTMSIFLSIAVLLTLKKNYVSKRRSFINKRDRTMISTRFRKENYATSDHLLNPNYWPGKETRLQTSMTRSHVFECGEILSNKVELKEFSLCNFSIPSKQFYFVFDGRHQKISLNIHQKKIKPILKLLFIYKLFILLILHLCSLLYSQYNNVSNV